MSFFDAFMALLPVSPTISCIIKKNECGFSCTRFYYLFCMAQNDVSQIDWIYDLSILVNSHVAAGDFVDEDDPVSYTHLTLPTKA